MLGVTIICEAKLKEKYLRDASDEYVKRLGAYCRLNIIELSPKKLPENPSDSEIANALNAEGKEILSKIPSGAKVFSMCIEGKQLSSYGLSDEVKKRSDFRLSMSEMTFPHQLARIMLLEQIYRVFRINSGGKYHK